MRKVSIRGVAGPNAKTFVGPPNTNVPEKDGKI
jgi:hypothetical protein